MLRQVWNAEELCGLIEPIVPLPPQVTCSLPITPQQCADCCFRQRTTVTLPGQAYAVHQLLQHLNRVREASLRQLEQQLVAKRQQAENHFQRYYDRIVFPTQSFREFFERTLPLPPERTVVIEPGMDGTRVIPAEFSGRKQPVRLLFLGNPLSKKGIADLAAVFVHSELVSRQEYTLTIAGGGDAQVLRKLLAANPQVPYQGGYTAEQLPALLQAAAVGLSPS